MGLEPPVQGHAPTIGAGTLDDLPALVGIYNHYVAASKSNFDTEPTTVAQRRDWFARFANSGPHRLLVAHQDGVAVGSASSSPYRDHEAFAETVEFGISLHPDHRGRGIGAQLYAELIQALTTERVHVAVAGIALPNDASVALHRRFGFTEVGAFREYAIKDGEYITSLWMQRLFPVDSATAAQPVAS